jgi:hypothetical protein
METTQLNSAFGTQGQNLTGNKSQFLDFILNSSVNDQNLTVENHLQKRKSSSTNLQLSQNLKNLEEKLSHSNTVSQKHRISLDQALAQAEKLLKTKSLLTSR